MSRRKRPAALVPLLQPSIDALVADAHATGEKTSGGAFRLVTRWCEAHPDESGLESGEHDEGFMIVSLDNELSGCSDEEMDLPEGTEEAELSDEIRVEYIRERLDAVFGMETDEADAYPMGCVIEIQASNGERASLAYLLSGGGCQGALGIDWQGVYRSPREFRDELRRRGALIGVNDVHKAADVDLLRLWRRPSSDVG
jgi:hypothetical protein